MSAILAVTWAVNARPGGGLGIIVTAAIAVIALGAFMLRRR